MTSITAPGSSRRSKRTSSRIRSATPRTRSRTRSGSSGAARSRGSVSWAPWPWLRPQRLTTRSVSKPKTILTTTRKLSPPPMMPLLLITTTTHTNTKTLQHAPLPLPLHRRVATTTRTRTTTKWSRRRRILSSTNLLSHFPSFIGVSLSCGQKRGRGKCKIEQRSGRGSPRSEHLQMGALSLLAKLSIMSSLIAALNHKATRGPWIKGARHVGAQALWRLKSWPYLLPESREIRRETLVLSSVPRRICQWSSPSMSPSF